MAIQESGEMYLETILVLEKKNGTVRAIDIAEQLGISKAAVSKAVSKYLVENLITIDSAGNITLSKNGLNIAQKIYERHITIADYLMRLGVDEETATADACRIEHVISEKSFEAMKKHNELHSGTAF